MSITQNIERLGRFTSSEIVALMAKDRSGKGFGAPALTYIEEKKMERRLGRSIDTETNARPTMWGILLENRVHDSLTLKYTLCSNQTVIHPKIEYWAGSTDGIKHGKFVTVADIKCPYTLKSFCQLVDPLYNGLSGIEAMNAIRENHKDGEKYYWQLVSNACINNATHAELIVYCPYQSELFEIRQYANGLDGYGWVVNASDAQLPYLPDNGYYKNINIISFEIPQEDKELLTERVIEAGKLLNPPLICHSDNGIVIVEQMKM